MASNKETEMQAGFSSLPKLTQLASSSNRMRNKDPMCLTAENNPYAAETCLYSPQRHEFYTRYLVKSYFIAVFTFVGPFFLVSRFPLDALLPIHKCCSSPATSCFCFPCFLALGLGRCLQREASQKPQLEEN